MVLGVNSKNHSSGQISSRPHEPTDFPQNVADKHLDWWNIISFGQMYDMLPHYGMSATRMVDFDGKCR